MFNLTDLNQGNADKFNSSKFVEEMDDGRIELLLAASRFYINDKLHTRTVIGLSTFMFGSYYMVEALNAEIIINLNIHSVSSIKLVRASKEQWWDLHIRDMSQNPDDPVPALLIRAKEFNIYEIETERDEQGNIKDRPSLADFIKWKEEQEESKEMVNK